MWLGGVLTFLFFYLGARKATTGLVPKGVQNVAEAVIDFVRNDVILQGIGPDGMRFLPFLVTVFTFVFVCNIFGIIPGIQMPVNARMAIPMFLALVVWVTHVEGIRWNGPVRYLKSWIPEVPKALLPLIVPLEILGQFMRLISLSVRLFANMLAGHLLLVTFAVLASALFSSTYVGAIFPGGLLIALTGFELLVAVLQAYIFVILTAVFIGGAMHPEH